MVLKLKHVPPVDLNPSTPHAPPTHPPHPARLILLVPVIWDQRLQMGWCLCCNC